MLFTGEVDDEHALAQAQELVESFPPESRSRNRLTLGWRASKAPTQDLSWVQAMSTGDYESAVKRAEAIEAPTAVVEALCRRARQLDIAGNMSQARANLRRAVELADKKIHDPHARSRVHARLALSQHLREYSEYADAIATIRETISILEDAHGPDDARLAPALFVLAGCLREVPAQPAPDAEDTYRRTIALLRRSPTPDRALWYGSFLALAEVLERKGRQAEAAQARREADLELQGEKPPGALVHEGPQLHVRIDDGGLVWFTNRTTGQRLFMLPARCLLEVELVQRSPAPPTLCLRGCFKHSALSEKDPMRERTLGSPFSAVELHQLEAALCQRFGLPVEVTKVSVRELAKDPDRLHGRHVRVEGADWVEGYSVSSLADAGASVSMPPSIEASPAMRDVGVAMRHWRVDVTGIWYASTSRSARSRGRSGRSLDVYDVTSIERIPDTATQSRAKRGAPFGEAERRSLLESYFDAFKRKERAELVPTGVEVDPLLLAETRRQMAAAAAQYVEAVPILCLSRCPFTHQVFESSIDHFGIDGLWWAYEYSYRPFVEPIPTLFAWTGALRLGAPVPAWSLKAMVGPEVPFVIPRMLSHPAISAVLSSLAIGPHTGFLIAYYAREAPDIERVDEWGARHHTLPNPRGGMMSSHSTQDDAQSDYDLEPWIADNRLHWIAPGDPTLTLRVGSEGCPYLNLPGERRRRYIQEGDTWFA